MVWIAFAVIVALSAAAVGLWQMRRRRLGRLISFVALVREHFALDPAVLARIAGKAWQADLGDGESEGADGFVAGAGPTIVIKHAERTFLINSFPGPYSDDVEKTALSIKDLRIRELFRAHQAWFSCDALGPDGATSDEDCLEWYRRLGPLFAELLDDNCLVIFLPEKDLAFPINDDTETALRSEDPVKSLLATLTVPIVEVPPDDRALARAVEQARAEWPKFVAAYEARAGENFSVKAPLSHAGNTEFIWISVTGLEGDRVYGKLGNDPGNLGSLRLGSKVAVLVAELNDWCYIDPAGKLTGGFTVEAVQNAMGRSRSH